MKILKYLKSHSILSGILIFAVWIGVFIAVTVRLEQESVGEQREALEMALERDITTCYALEGHFPPDLPYLREHYGLTYDETLFYVDYRPYGSNLRPFYIVLDNEEADGYRRELFRKGSRP